MHPVSTPRFARAKRSLVLATIVLGSVGFAGVAVADDSSDNAGAVDGNQVVVPLQVPIGVNCNALAILGDASSACDLMARAGGSTATIEDDSSVAAPGASDGTNEESAQSAPVAETSPQPQAADTAAQQNMLPKTGSSVTPLVISAVGLMLLGVIGLVFARRRRSAV